VQARRLSVVVVSWGRPRALARCLAALGQMRSIRFEVIVVADPHGLAVARGLALADQLVCVPQDQPNIAAARNLGLTTAAAEVIAFIDDDAVPEPNWVEAILAGFSDPAVSAVTGPVLGRNGVSLQWGRMASDARGYDRWLAGHEQPKPHETLKLHGTNMAVRRDALIQIGGFDRGFRFYLDETDLARRLGTAGAGLRYLPGAVVHHGFAASDRRRGDRVPLDLHDIGASTALFLRKHAPDSLETELERLLSEQRARLLRLARRRKIGTAEIKKLIEGLAQGIESGRARESEAPDLLPHVARSFCPVRKDLPPVMTWHDGWIHRAGMLRQTAAADVAAGNPTALILLEPTPRKHRLVFTDGGWWEQSGGLFGPTDRSGPRVQFWRYRSRIRAERARVFMPRG